MRQEQNARLSRNKCSNARTLLLFFLAYFMCRYKLNESSISAMVTSHRKFQLSIGGRHDYCQYTDRAWRVSAEELTRHGPTTVSTTQLCRTFASLISVQTAASSAWLQRAFTVVKNIDSKLPRHFSHEICLKQAQKPKTLFLRVFLVSFCYKRFW